MALVAAFGLRSEGGALVAIARALAGHPRILLLDEATSHIDSETEQVVQRTLAELRGRVTVIAIAHRLSTVRDADRIVVPNHGKVAELGPHEALMAIPDGLYQWLYLLQQLRQDERRPSEGGTRLPASAGRD